MLKNEKLYTACKSQKETFISLWEKLVNIDTGTGYGIGIEKMATIVENELKALHADIEQVPVNNYEGGHHIVGRFHGHGEGSVLIMAHMDTVFPEGTASKRPFKIVNDWAYGPGVSDCKGSIVLILSAMKKLQEMNFDNFKQITCLFNCDEEMASFDSRDLIKKMAQEHDVTLCVESGQVGDGVVKWRKGSATLQVEVTGVSSHAGSNPEKGHNALMELLHQINVMSSLGNPELLTTINFTKMQSGNKINVIPDYAVAFADIRVVDTKEINRIEKAVKASSVVTKVKGTHVDITLIRDNPPFPQNKKTDLLIQVAQNIYKEIDHQLIAIGAGGASDANWAASTGAIVVDGFGPVKGGKNHTERECTKVSSIVPRMYLLTRMLMEIGIRNYGCERKLLI